MELGPGSRLDAFEIVRCLGVGGMGEVWLARDRTLHRLVAIKLLPPDVSGDADRIERFRREALAASALNHPNVCTIHALGTTNEGRLFIAMEYIEGGPLRDRLARPIPINDVIDIAAQTAAGLAAAHGSGVIHRDVKPENIMIRPDGLVKVLDFGLARMSSSAARFDGASTLTAVDSHGAVAGTLGYMSPEQARGEPLDARTDVFSFGAVLYEMVTGRAPFASSTPALVHDRILNRPPEPVRHLNPGVPAQLEGIIQKALEKNRDGRYQSASELRADLVRLQRDADVGGVVPARFLGGWRGRGVVGFAVAVALALAAVGLFRWRTTHVIPDAELEEIQLTSNSPENPVLAATISPDGRHVAYADTAGVHVRGIETGEVHTLAAPGIANVNNVRFFPDGMKLLVSGTERGGETLVIWSVSLVGGAPRAIRTGGFEAAVSTDGLQIAFLSAERRNVWVMGPNGEQARPVVSGSAEDQFFFPAWVPEGLAYSRVRATTDKAGVVTREVWGELLGPQGRRRGFLVEPGATTGTRLSGNRWLYSVVVEPTLTGSGWSGSPPPGRGAGLWEVSLDRKSLRPIAPPRRRRQWPGGVKLMDMTSTADGSRVTFLKQILQKDVYVAELRQDGLADNPRRLTLDDANDVGTRWTPDARALFFASDRNGTLDVFRQRLDSSVAEAVISGPDDESGPIAISPDGSWLYYTISPDGSRSAPRAGKRLMRTPEPGGPREQLADESRLSLVLCARPPSTACVFAEQVGADVSIYAFDPQAGKGRRITGTTVSSGLQADISPDGSQVAVLLPAERRIRVLPVDGATARDVVVAGRPVDDAPIHWSFDGRGWYVSSTPPTYPAGTELLYVDLEGRPRVAWRQNVRGWTSAIPAPDGRHIALTHTSAATNVWLLKGL